MSKNSNKSVNINKGDYGEVIGTGYLRAKGFEILAAKYKGPKGEIDIIARLGDLICFVEVKLRKTTKAGSGASAVTLAKQRNLIKTAEQFIAENENPSSAYRFDVLEIFGRENYTVNHIENAFYADGG